MLIRLAEKGFDLESHNHAGAILTTDFPEALVEIEKVLDELIIPIGEIIGSGGGEADSTQRMRHSFYGCNWPKHNFVIQKIIDGEEKTSISHEIDHVKTIAKDEKVYKIALEIEWNNKDPFFDRDLENFKRLYLEGVISVGVIITRGKSLQDAFVQLALDFAHKNQIHSYDDLFVFGCKAPSQRQRDGVLRRVGRAKEPMSFQESWARFFVSDKYGQATTHWRKLQDRVHRGVGSPCPLLLIGIPLSVVEP